MSRSSQTGRSASRRILSLRVLAGVIISVLIVSLFPILPRATAVTVDVQGISPNQQVPQSGAPFQFNVTITIGLNERVPVNEVRIILDSTTLRYAVNGTQIVPQGGQFNQAIPNLILLNPPPSQLQTNQSYGLLQGYGFTSGYGVGTNYGVPSYGVGFFGPVTLKYSVTIFPAQLQPGPHNLRVDILTGLTPQNYFSSQTFSFLVAGGGFVPGAGPDFIITMPNTAYSMAPGTNRSRALNLISVNSFVGNVQLDFQGPPDITARFNGQPTATVSLAAGETKTVLLNISASTFAPPGSKFAGIQGQSGSLVHVLNLQVNIAISGVPTLIASPNIVSPGGSMTLSAFGFTANSPMTLQLQLPTGFMTITPTSYAGNNPNVATDGTWGATVTVPSNAPVGQFTLKVADNASPPKAAFIQITTMGTGNDFLLSVSPSFIDAPPAGGSLTVLLTVTSLNQFNSQVSLSLQGVPPGVLTVTLGQSQVTPPTGGSAPSIPITIQASGNAPPGSYFISVQGVSTNLIHQTSFTVNIPFKSDFFTQFSIGSISLSPSFGTAGSSVTLSGSGFPAGSTFNSIYFGRFGVSQDLVTLPSTVTVSQSGSFSTQFPVPSLMSGMYPVTVEAGGFRDMKDFRLVSGDASFQLSVSPSALPPASPGGTTTLTITVSSLNGKTPTVALSVTGLPSPTFTTTLAQSSLTPPSGGTASTTLTIVTSSTAPPSPYPLNIEGRSGSEVQVMNIPFGIKPPDMFFTQFNIASVTLTPNYGAKGATVTVQGSGFPTESGNTITGYRFGSVTKTFTPPVPVSNDGTFSAVIKTPTEAEIFEGGRYPVEFTSTGSSPPRTAMSDFSVISTSGKYMLTVSPTFLPPVVQGGTATLAVSLTSVNQQTPTVTLSVRGLPPKITYSLDGSSTATVTLSQGESKTVSLVLSVDTYAPPGPYPFEIRGVVSGSDERIVQIMFGVMPRLQFGLANILISPDIGARGASVTISGSGFNPTAGTKINSVQLGPRTITFTTPVSVTNGAFTAVITPPSDMPFGIHPLTVTDTGTPPRSDTKPFTVISTGVSFNIFASPPFIGPVLQGSSASTKLSIQSFNNQNPNVDLRIDGLPPGVTASWDQAMPIPVKAGQTATTVLTLTVPATVMPGPYGLSITGKAGTEVVNIHLGFGVMPNIGGGLGFASIVVNPNFGRPGDQLTVSGAGFQSGQAVSLFVKPPGAPFEVTISSGEITVQSGGDWSFTGKIPSDTPPGFYEMIARSGTRESRAPFNVAPGSAEAFFIQLSPRFIRVNQGASAESTITVKSANSFASSLIFGIEGLPPGVTVTFYKEDQTSIGSYSGTGFGNTRVSPAVAVTPPAGGVLKIAVRVTVSSTLPPGPYPIFIRVDIVGGRGSSEVLGLDVYPTGGTSISLNPGDGEAGGQVTISGVGYGNTENINIIFAGTAISTIPTTVTAVDGAFSATITVPSNLLQGLYPVEARGATTNKVSVRPFAIKPKINAFVFYAAPQITISPGGSGDLSLTIDPLGTFNSAIALSVSGLPSGATAAFSPSSTVTPTVGTPSSVILTITLPSNAAPGMYFLRLNAAGGGVSIDIMTSVRVSPSATEQDFEVILGPPHIALPQGGTGTIDVIIRGFNSFASDVTLTTQTTVSGITRTLGSTTVTPSATTGFGKTTLTVTLATNVPPGAYQVQVTGTSGTKVRTNVLQIGVFPSGITITSFAPPAVLPHRITPQTPLPINPPWGDKIQINTLNSPTNEPTQVIPKNIPRPPSDLAPMPTGFTAATSKFTSIEPTSKVDRVNASLTLPYNLTLITSLGLTPSNLRVAFLADNGTWISVQTSFNATAGTVSANITHFSSWTVLGVQAVTTPAAVAPPVIPGAPAATTTTTTVTSSTPVVDNTATANVMVQLSGAVYIGTQGSITTAKYTTTPTTTVTVTAATGATPVKYVDVQASNIASGTATITVTYTDSEVASIGESTLTLYYYSQGRWTALANIMRDTAANKVTGSIDVTKLTGTIISLAGTTTEQVTASLTADSITLAPGSSIKITLTLNSTTLLEQGNITFTLPTGFTATKVTTTGFEGTVTQSSALKIQKTTATTSSKTATVTFTLTASLKDTKVGATAQVTVDVTVKGLTTTYTTDKTVTLTLQKPTAANIFSTLDSYFAGTASSYTEDRAPTATDIFKLLDHYFGT